MLLKKTMHTSAAPSRRMLLPATSSRRTATPAAPSRRSLLCNSGIPQSQNTIGCVRKKRQASPVPKYSPPLHRGGGYFPPLHRGGCYFPPLHRGGGFFPPLHRGGLMSVAFRGSNAGEAVYQQILYDAYPEGWRVGSHHPVGEILITPAGPDSIRPVGQ